MSKMKNASKVYFGPDTSIYPEMGRVGKGEFVTVLWKERTWCYIEYMVTNTDYDKRGYVKTRDVNVTETVQTKIMPSLPRYVQRESKVFYGPNPHDFQVAGSVSYGEEVTYLGQKTTGVSYAFIQYNVTGTSKKKRAWIFADNLATGRPSGLVVGQFPPGMNIHGPCYTTNNWYYNANPAHTLQGECTWYCWGRALEKCGKRIQFTGDNNGCHWYANCNYRASGATARAASQGPVTNSICSCSGGTSAGHVIFVELVSGNTVYYTEAHVGGTDGIVKSCTKANFPPRSRTPYGYIVL